MHIIDHHSPSAVLGKANEAVVGNKNVSKPASTDSRLAIWLKKLPKNPLPIDQTVANTVLALLGDDRCDSPTLAAAIQKDPLLCLKLFHGAAQQLNQKEGGIQHLVHLIGLIGHNKIYDVVSKSRTLSAPPEGFQEILSASLFAAHLSSALLNKKHNATSDRFFLPTLFFNAPLWLMWVAAPKTMSHGKVLASQKPQSYIALSVKKLGFKLPDLLERANELILLPQMSLDALAINPIKQRHFWAKAHLLSEDKLAQWFAKDKSARNLFFSVEAGVYLINQYVIAIYFDWNGKYIQRCATLLCRHLGISDEALHAAVIALATSIPLPTQFQGLLAPINRLRGLHRDPECDFVDTFTNNAPLQPAIVNAWREKIRQSDNAETALAITMNALAKGVGVEHCVIMEVDEHDIHTQTCYGFADKPEINGFHSDWHTEKSLFQQMISKPCCISVSPEDLPKASAKMPKQFTESCDIQPCGLLSVFHHKKPKALIYCDHHQWDEQRHHYFKAVGKELAHTLDRL